VVCTGDDLPAPAVDIIDDGLSDHRLLRWSSSLLRPTPIFVTSFRRCWQSFDPDVFRTDLLASTLCDVQSHNDLDSDILASLYDFTITELLDRQVPARSVSCRLASGESRPPRRSTRFFLLIGRHCVARSASRLL